MTTAGILLAAGPSQRFGPDDKLLAVYRGRPLVTHAAEALRGAGCDFLVAVVGRPEVAAELGEFRPVYPAHGEPMQALSLRTGIAAARTLGVDRAVIVLGDMPGVTAALIRRVVDRCADDTPSASHDGTRIAPPACFPASLFEALMTIDGDQGARTLLRGLPAAALVRTDPEQLRDIDTPGDLPA